MGRDLVQATKNQERETIFIFTSDNGAVAYQKKTSNKSARKRTGCNYPLKGFKDDIHAEGGTRVPTWVYSTQRQFKSRSVEELVHLIDWFPTILQLAGHQ